MNAELIVGFNAYGSAWRSRDTNAIDRSAIKITRLRLA
jgi:hypothetical protein